MPRRRHLCLWIPTALILLLSGCWPFRSSVDGPPVGVYDVSDGTVIPRQEPRSRYGNPKSYTVKGKRYHVMKDASGFVQRGIASWYGRKFHGRRTSSGETYDMHALSAAHKTLPLPSYVKVRNLENGRELVLRVNDRGPFYDARIIDLSYAAAVRLGIHPKGTARVEVRVLEPAAGAGRVADAPHSGAQLVQLGAFREHENAEKLLWRLRAQGLEGGRIETARAQGRPVYRVLLGPVQGEAMQRLQKQLQRLGVMSYFLRAAP